MSHDTMTVTQVSRKELTAGQVTDILETGGRVVIELSVLGKSTKVVIRRHSGTYYCDTPMKLMRYDTSEELQNCLERFQLVKQEREGTTGVVRSPA